MFKPASAEDRINYGEVLMPPVGYKLERAVGTTYSLDLETLTAVSIALGLREDTDSELINNPISMLRALQKISDRILVFCEAGQIKLPAKSNALCLTLEKMVVPVTVPFDKKINRYPAFHPKTWLLEYGKEYSNEDGGNWYRFVVMSRNMTFDHSWDVACALDGDTTSTGKVSAEPIADFLVFLRKQLNKELANYSRQYSDISYLIETMPQVSFRLEKGFSECSILPLGIGNGSYNMASSGLFTENFHELVVMSPFLTGSVIEGFNDNSKTLTGTTRTLITRRSELPKIKGGKAANFNVYVMKDDIIDGESAISDGEDKQPEEEPGKQDIHAKIYIRRKDSMTDLYLGSMNASYAAINSNVEMMVRLRTESGVLNGEKFLDEIMGDDRNGEGKKNPFELVLLDGIDDSDDTSVQDNVEQLIKWICRIKMTATAELKDGKYNIHISADIDSKVDGVSVRPLLSSKEETNKAGSSKKSELLPEMEFTALDILQLSEFYVVSAAIDDCTLERVIMIPTSGIPEGRDAEIIKNVIKTKNQFIEYVAFILGDDYIQTFLENKKSSGAYGGRNQNSTFPAVYEKMLKTSISDQDRLSEIQYIMKAIEAEEIIPPEFREMYDVFCNTLGIKQV